MEAINIELFRNQREQDWSVQIDGNRYDHVSSQTLDELIEYALVAAQQNLLESEGLSDGSQEDSEVCPPCD